MRIMTEQQIGITTELILSGNKIGILSLLVYKRSTIQKQFAHKSDNIIETRHFTAQTNW